MNSHVKKTLFFLVLLLALLSLAGISFKAYNLLERIDYVFLMVGAVFFVLSIITWIIAWAIGLKKYRNVSFKDAFDAGFSSVYGSLTPLQLGSDYLRALYGKSIAGIPYSETVSSSLLVRGLKLISLSILSSSIIGYFLFYLGDIHAVLLIALIAGFAFIAGITLLFVLSLIPLFRDWIKTLSQKLFDRSDYTKWVHNIYLSYYELLNSISFKAILLVFVLASVSWLFEFLALTYSFKALGISLSLVSLSVLLILVAVLERTPFLPRGIGVVEFVGYAYLSIPFFAGSVLSLSEIWAVLIAYDLVRIVIPVVLSLLYALQFKPLKEEDIKRVKKKAGTPS